MVEEKEAEEVEGTTTCLAIPVAENTPVDDEAPCYECIRCPNMSTLGCTWP